jgi:peptidoglycan/xylan/chitin deacetylase (PgdA/CDA1 family)
MLSRSHSLFSPMLTPSRCHPRDGGDPRREQLVRSETSAIASTRSFRNRIAIRALAFLRTFPVWVSAFAGMTVVAVFACVVSNEASAQSSCSAGTLYLTFDTGHMEPASQIADILAKHDVKATFFLANEKTKSGGFSLDDQQKPFWQRLAKEGHAFGSHTWDHHYFLGNVGADNVSYIPWGAKSGRTLDRAGVCAELKKSEDRFREMTGRGYDGLWRAPGGKTMPRLLEFAKSCGYTHVHWADTGFLGDELPSETYSNESLVKRAVANLRDGDILMAHLGIWSRKDPYWPMLDPLIAQLKVKGFCFATLKGAKLGDGINQRVKR